MFTPPSVDPLIGQNVGGYVIEDLIGEGGMGLVYRARHPILDRRFAVKVLRPDVANDPSLSHHFIREAQTLSGLKHPNIIDIVGFGPLDDGRQFMVTEFLDGRTVEHELIEYGKVPPLRAVILADQVLSALAAAHAVDVVHRDLKPANIFLSKSSGGTEIVKLLDFGLAKQQPTTLQGGPDAGGKSIIAGTPEYVAPEQALGETARGYSDLYSFGVTLFEMLTGRRPFNPPESDDRVTVLMRMHLATTAPSIGPGFPEELEVLVGDLLKKKPSERPASADAVRARLQTIRATLEAENQNSHAPAHTPSRLPWDTLTPTPPKPVTGPALKAPLARWPMWVLLGTVCAGAVLTFAMAERSGAAPIEADEAPVASPHVVKTAVLPAVKPAEDELEALHPIKPAQPIQTPLPQPRPKTVTQVAHAAPPVTPACEPDERWKQVAKLHLQEAQQRVAAKDDGTLWAAFEREEDAVSTAIANARTPADCAAVDAKILALTPRPDSSAAP